MQRIGRYELIDELGRGAMGVVYRARDTQIGRVVALKVILTRSASPAEAEHYKQRFQREAQAAGRLSHPGIVTLHDIAEDTEGQPYIVMEFIEGRPLNLLFGPASPAPLDRILDIGIQVAQALEFAHRSGVVHRDIKPENIMVTHEGRAKITDFGIAKLAGIDLTQEGTSLGTPSYMSPEQFHGAAVDARSDLFSLGAVLYWMCTGQKPFPGESVTTITFQVLFQSPARANELKPGLPPDLDRILSRCLAKDPADRYASCADLAADLQAIRAGQPLAERTAALPVAAQPPSPRHGDTTLPLDAPIAKARPSARASATLAAATPTTPATPAAGLSPAPRVARYPGWGLARFVTIAIVLVVALLFGVDRLIHRPPQVESSAPPPAPAPSPSPAPPVAANVPEKSPASPVPSISKPAEPSAVPAATAKLQIVCKHNFYSATLEVFLDDRTFYRATLAGKEHNYGLKRRFEGKLDVERPIPAGHHSLRVRVISSRDHYDDQDVLQGDFTAGEARTLEIGFGKGSALGMVERNVNLTLY